LVALAVIAAMGGLDGNADAKEAVFDQTFAVASGGKLKASVGDMDVLLRSGNSNEAHVEVTLSGDIDKMRERYEKMNFEAELDGNTLVISTHEKRSWWGGSWSGGRGSILVTVTLPDKFDVYAQTSDGDITAGGIEGTIELKTSDGDVEVDALAGDSVYLKTSDGDINVAEIKSKEINLRTSDGDVRAEYLKGEDVTLATSDGNVEAGKIDATSISARSSDGDLELNLVGEAGDLEARTSDGDIDVSIDGKFSLNLSTSDGDIVIRAPKDFGAMVDLKGERVKLGGKIALEGEVTERRISGKLGDGGPNIRARTSDGTVALRFK